MSTSVAMTGMKYCSGRTIPFISRDMVSTPRTNLSEKECPIPDRMPVKKAVSRTINMDRSGKRILQMSTADTRSSATSTMNAPVNP